MLKCIQMSIINMCAMVWLKLVLIVVKSKLDSGHVRENIVLFYLNLKEFLVKNQRALKGNFKFLRLVAPEKWKKSPYSQKMLFMVGGFNEKIWNFETKNIRRK